MTGELLLIRGQVQGVGFRPTVWRIATEMGLAGDVRNTAEGVEIRLWGEARAHFEQRLRAELPVLARIDHLERTPLAEAPPQGFEIAPSAGGTMRASVTPDAATCPECLAEIRDPFERRFRYPFANCTNCGPRFSIVEGAPWDRAITTMAGFQMCRDCSVEYNSPADRRYHAEAIACHACGPKVWLEKLDGGVVPFDAFSMLDAVDAVGGMLLKQHIVAIKGIGGFHLACDATSERVVSQLRTGKQRERKAFALMARDLTVIRRYCSVSVEEAALLASAAAPIVLLKNDGERLPDAVAPGLDRLGFMLPHTPLHHLMLRRVDRPVVMTSGNLSGQPQATDNEQARRDLRLIADFALLHDRTIANRIDDSVVRVDLGVPRMLRRARGYAPAPLPLPEGFDTSARLLAMGAEVKNAFCIVKDGRAVLSQHMGDLEDATIADDVARNLTLYRGLYEFDPAVIAIDRHPDYLSSQQGRELAQEEKLNVVEVQHHHAHIAACLAENGRPLAAAPVLGIAIDGLGLGDDGTLWGGEFLVADYLAYTRAGHLKPVALPGGAAAIREPWRNAYAHLRAEMSWAELSMNFAGLPLFGLLGRLPRDTLDAMIRSGMNAPLSSSGGRLFDAAAAIAGLAWSAQGYEGEAAMRFEAVIDRRALDESEDYIYPFTLPLMGGRGLPYIEPVWMWRAMLGDLHLGTPLGVIAARFHRGLARAVVQMAARITDKHQLDTVALTGGCFQNATLFRLVHAGLAQRGLKVLSHAQVPANDGGLALGQAVVALATLQKRGGSHVSWHTRSGH